VAATGARRQTCYERDLPATANRLDPLAFEYRHRRFHGPRAHRERDLARGPHVILYVYGPGGWWACSWSPQQPAFLRSLIAAAHGVESLSPGPAARASTTRGLDCSSDSRVTPASASPSLVGGKKALGHRDPRVAPALAGSGANPFVESRLPHTVRLRRERRAASR